MWAQFINTALGIWLMVAPAVLGYGGAARANDRIVGPIVATFACIAIWEVTRPLRWINLPLGLWLMLCPWLLSYGQMPLINSLLVGLALAAFSLPKGKRAGFAGGWSMLCQDVPPAD